MGEFIMSYKDGKLDKEELEEIIDDAKKKDYEVLNKFDKEELKEASEEVIEMKKEEDKNKLDNKSETIKNVVQNLK